MSCASDGRGGREETRRGGRAAWRAFSRAVHRVVGVRRRSRRCTAWAKRLAGQRLRGVPRARARRRAPPSAVEEARPASRGTPERCAAAGASPPSAGRASPRAACGAAMSRALRAPARVRRGIVARARATSLTCFAAHALVRREASQPGPSHRAMATFGKPRRTHPSARVVPRSPPERRPRRAATAPARRRRSPVERCEGGRPALGQRNSKTRSQPVQVVHREKASGSSSDRFPDDRGVARLRVGVLRAGVRAPGAAAGAGGEEDRARGGASEEGDLRGVAGRAHAAELRRRRRRPLATAGAPFRGRIRRRARPDGIRRYAYGRAPCAM